MNNSGPTAQIVERDGWKTNMDFVGHRKAVTVVVRNRLKPTILSHLWASRLGTPKETLPKIYEWVNLCFLAEIQPENLQEEAEKWRLSKTQLSLLLLRGGQQRPIALCLGQSTRKIDFYFTTVDSVVITFPTVTNEYFLLLSWPPWSAPW